MTGRDAAAAAVSPQAWDAFRRALLTVRVGHRLTVDTIRGELEAAGLSGNTLGGLFTVACRVGWLEATDRFVPSCDRSARGRRVQVYRRLPIEQQQQRRAA